MHESPRLKPPTRRGMALLAVSVLKAEMAAAWIGPTKLSDAARLALGWLMHDGIALDHQAGRFVAGVTTQGDMVGTVPGYMRQTEMEQMLLTWEAEIRARDWRAQA